MNQSQGSEPKLHLVHNFGLYSSNCDSASTGPQSETRDLGIKSASILMNGMGESKARKPGCGSDLSQK